MDLITHSILAIATSPWVYVLAMALVVLDGVFPLFPSEVVIVGLASLAASSAAPDAILLVLVGATGAMLGDMLTYLLGRTMGVRSLQATRFRPLARMLRYAGRRLTPRAGTVILTARFVPFARLAVNLTAGSTGFPLVRFVPYCVVAGMAWALYNVGMGTLAGRWFTDQPLLGMALAIGLAVLLGLLVDAIAIRLPRRRPTA